MALSFATSALSSDWQVCLLKVTLLYICDYFHENTGLVDFDSTLITGYVVSNIVHMKISPFYGVVCVLHSCWCWFLVLPHDAAI